MLGAVLSLATAVGKPPSEAGGEDAVGGDEASTDSTSPSAESAIQIRLDRDSPFFEPGESLRAVIEIDLPASHPGSDGTLVYDLRRVADGMMVDEQRPTWSGASGDEDGDREGSTEPVEVKSTLPSVAGVYELRCRLFPRSDRLWSPWRRRPSESLATDAMPLIVLDEPTASDRDSGSDSDSDSELGSAVRQSEWEQVGQLRATDSRDWSIGPWLPTRRSGLISGDDSQSLAKLEQQQHAGEVVAVIPPGQVLESTLPHQTSGRPHRITLRFPRGRPLKLRVDLVDGRSGELTGQSFILREDSRLRVQDPWRVHTFVTYPGPGGEQLRLTNLDSAAPALLESIRVDAGPDRLADPPPVNSGGRRQAALHLRSMDWMKQITCDIARDERMNEYARPTVAVHRAMVAAERLTDYVRAVGINGVVIPINRSGASWSSSGNDGDHNFGEGERSAVDDALAATGLRREAVLRSLDQTELHVLLRLDPSFPLAAVEDSRREDSSRDAELLRRRAAPGTGRRYNPFHPLVRRSFVAELERIAAEYRQFECVGGIVLASGADSHLRVVLENDRMIDPVFADQFVRGRSDLTMPESQRRAWALREGQPELSDWMRKQTGELFAELASAVSDHSLVVVDETEQGRSPGEWVFGESVWTAAAGSASGEASDRLQPTVSWLRPPAESLSRYLHRDKSAAGERDVDVRKGPRFALRLGTIPARPGALPETVSGETRRDFSRQADHFDPSLILLELPLAAGELSTGLTEMIREFTRLPVSPGERHEPNDAADQTVGVRVYREGNGMKVAIANRAPWRVEVELKIAAGEEKREQVVVPAQGWTVVESGDGAKLVRWSARPSGGIETVKSIRAEVKAVFERLGTLTTLEDYSALSNGGFERASDVGLAGWLHAQYPPDAVGIDDDEAIEGRQSIRMSNSAEVSNRAWLVSETVPAPDSGRIAISLACRAAARQEESPHRLRVAIEGIDRDGPFKQAVDLEIPRSGEWQSRRVVLEVDGVGPTGVDELRLTLDSLSSGRIWVDDVHFHDWFPTAAERSELRSQAYLAVQGLQQASLTAASRLLQNFWAGELLADFDPTAEAGGPESGAGEEATGGMAAWMREWLPQPLRF